jgi:spermidine/putrescine transport system permease protein
MEAATAPPPRAESRPGLIRAGRKVLHHSLGAYAVVALGYLLLPIAIILLFSFNNPTGRFNYQWDGFTLDNWLHPFAVSELTDAFIRSLEVAVIATLVSTVLGTFMALALVRYEFRGRPAVNFFIFLPLATPEVVLGAALLSLFLSFGVNPGLGTIVIAHIMFCVSFVVVTVRSRLIGFDHSLEEAAQDLGATGPQTFLRVTLPLIMPGVLAGGLLAFALSIDDYVITSFNSGSTITYPLWIFGASQRAVPPQVNVLAAIIFLFTVAIMVFTVWQQRRAEKMAATQPA